MDSPALVQETLERYLAGDYDVEEAARRLCHAMGPTHLDGFTIAVPLKDAATPQGRRLSELHGAVLRLRSRALDLSAE